MAHLRLSVTSWGEPEGRGRGMGENIPLEHSQALEVTTEDEHNQD